MGVCYHYFYFVCAFINCQQIKIVRAGEMAQLLKLFTTKTICNCFYLSFISMYESISNDLNWKQKKNSTNKQTNKHYQHFNLDM